MNELLQFFAPYSSFLESLLVPLEVTLVLTAFVITTTNSISHDIQWYRWQSFILASVVGLTAIIEVVEGGTASRGVAALILAIIILPLTLGVTIKWILSRATVVTPGLVMSRQQMERAAKQEWLQYSTTNTVRMRDRFIFIILVAIAFVIAFQIIAGDFEPSERIGLAVSLALHLLGLYNMVVSRDTISQVVGLLVMDHGLYLAVVKVVAIPVPAGFFVVSLYFYTLITLLILFYLLPSVRQTTKTIDLDQIAEYSELKG